MAAHEDYADGPPPRPSPPRRRREGIVIEGKPTAYRWRAAPVAPAWRALASAALGGAVGAGLTLACVLWGADLLPPLQQTREQPASAEPRALADRLAADEKAASDVRAELAAIKDDLAMSLRTAAQAARDRTRIDALEAALPTAAPQASWAAAASALRRRFDAGEPLANELAALDRLGAPAAALAPLRPFVAAGAPSLPALALAVRQLAPSLAAAETPAAAEDGALDRLFRRLQGLAKIRKVGESRAGDVAARAGDALARGDLAGALADLNALPPPARAAAQGWIEGAQARLAADEAAQALTREAADPGGARR